MPKIERFAKGEPKAWQPVYALLSRGDFALTLRSLLTIGRLKDAAAVPVLCQRVLTEDSCPIRLMLLDALLMLAEVSETALITPFAPLLSLRGDDLFLRGLVWYVGAAARYSGEDALALLSEKILATKQWMRIRDELLTEAVFFAARCDRAFLEKRAERDAVLRRWLRYRLLPEKAYAPHFFVYPSPDYLLQIAVAHGIDEAQYRKLFHWDRDKKPRFPGPKLA